MIRLNATLLGLPLIAYPPDARYYRAHEIALAPEVDQTPVARKVSTPARYADGSGAYPAGTLLCAAGTTWEHDGRYVDPLARIFHRDGELVLVASVLGLDVRVADSAEARALHAEISALNAAWTAANADRVKSEDDRTSAIARAAVHDETGRDRLIDPPHETECLECGAVYERPGSVEPGGMSCRRCN